MTTHNESERVSRASKPSALFIEFFGSRIGAAFLSLATFIVVTRSATVEVAGIYISAISYGVLLYSLLDLGTGPQLVRNSVEGDTRRQIAEYVWTRAVLTVGVVMAGAIGVVLLFPPEGFAAGFISLIYVASSMNSIAGPVGQVIGNASAYRALTLLQGFAVFTSVTCVALLTNSPTAAELVLAFSLSGLLTSVFGLHWVRGKMSRVALAHVPRVAYRQIRAVATLALATGAGSLYLRVDQAMVLKMLGPTAAAFYGLGSRIAIQARLAPSALQLSVGALLADRLQTDGSLSVRESRLLAKTALSGGLGISMFVIALADLAVFVLGGASYSSAVPPTLILAVSLVATTYSYVVGTALIMRGDDQRYLAVMLGAVIFNVAANLFAINAFGIEGAAVVAALTELGAVTAIAAAVGSSGGAASPLRFITAVAIASLAGVLKYFSLDRDFGEKLLLSATLLFVASIMLKSAFDALKELPNADLSAP